MTRGSARAAATRELVWLVDATTYRVNLPRELAEVKERYFRLQTSARVKAFGPHPPRGAESYSAGLLRIAEILTQSGHEVRYLTFDDAAAAIIDGGSTEIPSVIGFGAVCPTVPKCAALAEAARAMFPATRLVLGGAHAAVAAELTHWRFPVFDAVVRDRDTNAASALATVIEQPRDYSLPYHVLPKPVQRYGINLMTTEGCPFSCAYCQDRLIAHGEGRFDGGLTDLVDVLEPRTPVHFCDSVFGGGRRRTLEICRVLRNLDHALLLSCDIRAELLTPDIATALEAAGFVEVRIGLDSADEVVLREATRKATPSRLLIALETIKEHTNLFVSIYLVSGLPGTAEQTWEQNLDAVEHLLRARLADQVKHHLYVPYPTDVIPNGGFGVQLISHDWSAYDRNSYPVYSLPTLTPDVLWDQFVTTERRITDVWSTTLSDDNLDAAPPYSDYNGRVYLGLQWGDHP